MKFFLSILISSFAWFAQANPAEIGQVALEALVNVNPKLNTGEKVNSAIASAMLSSFTSQGKGILSVSTSECFPTQNRSNLYKCILKISSTPRAITQDGSFVPFRPGVRSSTLQILFNVEVTASAIQVRGEVSASRL